MFAEKIIRWYEENRRQLPWRGIRDPYRIWLSEIILQQTRIEQGRPYYERFVEAFPTVADLANASEEQVLKLWQGLGYYSRARNLHAAARHIATELGGQFPTTYEGVLALKGVGRYTAAAIVSFAYRLPYPVIDGNVYRVMARVFGITTPIATDTAYKEFESRLLTLIDRSRPDLFNQAMMDFGATYCKPTGSDCDHCIFHHECDARRTGRVALLPVRPAAAKVRTRFFYYLDLRWQSDGQSLTIVQQRQSRDIWKGLYQFPLIESDRSLTEKELKEKITQWLTEHCRPTANHNAPQTDEGLPYTITAPAWQATHKLTHQTIEATFVRITLAADIALTPAATSAALRIIPTTQVKQLPIPRLIERYLQHKQISHN